MNPKQRLIQALCEQQIKLGLTQEQFAEKLGINRSTWNWVREGINQPGLRVLAGVAKSFPELKNELIAYLETYSPETETQLRAS